MKKVCIVLVLMLVSFLGVVVNVYYEEWIVVGGKVNWIIG